MGSAELRTRRPEGWTLTEEEVEVRLWVRRVWVRPLRLLRRHTGETSALQGVQDCSILERKNWKPMDLIPVVCSWSPMILLGRNNWSKLSGKNRDPQVSKETEKQVLLPLPWFLLPSPPLGAPEMVPRAICKALGLEAHPTSPRNQAVR